MGVTYKNLRQLLIDKKLQWQDIHKETGVSWGTIAHINKDDYVNLKTLEKIARYLKVDIGDIVEIK